MTFVKNIFNECGYTYIWDTHTLPNSAWLNLNIKQKLQDQFIQSWFSNLENSGKTLNYRLFKKQFETENYRYSLADNFLYEFCRLRTHNYKLPIESGRWQNLDRNMRICNLCVENEIRDEFQYILECNYFNNNQKKNIDDRNRKRPNIIKFDELMSIKKIKLTKLCKFIQLINKAVCARG